MNRRQLLTGFAAVGVAATAGAVASSGPATAHPSLPTTIHLPNAWLPEGIAIGRGPFAYFGSRADGDIYRANLLTGAGTVISQGPGAGFPSVGLKIDGRGRLFVAGGTAGTGRVVSAITGEILADHTFTTDPSFVNDVVLTPHAAYFTDSRNPFLYAVSRHRVRTIPLTGDIVYTTGNNANGIARTPDGRALLVVQSNTGLLFRVNPESGDARLVDLDGFSPGSARASRQEFGQQVGGRAMLHTGEMPQTKGLNALLAASASAPRRGRHAAEKTTMLPTINAATAIPKRLGYAIGAGVLAVVLLATVAWAVLRDDEQPITQPPAPSAAPTPVPSKTSQTVTFKGITLDVPIGWKAYPAGAYVDYRHPKDPERRLRLSVTSEKDAQKALESADRRHTFCKESDGAVYEKLGLSETELAGAKAAELEYRCTVKDKQPKHALWQIVIIDGKACHVYLSTWDSTWTADKPVYDTAVASFKFA